MATSSTEAVAVPSVTKEEAPSAAKVEAPSTAKVEAPSAAKVEAPSAAKVEAAPPKPSVITQVTSLADFEALLASNTYVVTDFFADWCPPCKAIAPLYNKFANEYSVPEHFAFAKVNVDSAKDIARAYQVNAMPTFLFFENKEKTQTVRGANPPMLKKLVEEISPKAKAKAAAVATGAEGVVKPAAEVSGVVDAAAVKPAVKPAAEVSGAADAAAVKPAAAAADSLSNASPV